MIHEIKALYDQGNELTIRAIARQLEISRNILLKYLHIDETAIAGQQASRVRHRQLEEKTRLRQQLAQPVLDDLKAWLENNRTRVPRDSLTYQAIQYTLNQWELLIGYLVDGRLHISNALAENAIRPFAVGRRNWLFADTPRGAKASAAVYGLIETARANGLEPFAQLHHVLQHIGGANTVEDIEALLPWNVDLKVKQEG